MSLQSQQVKPWSRDNQFDFWTQSIRVLSMILLSSHLKHCRHWQSSWSKPLVWSQGVDPGKVLSLLSGLVFPPSPLWAIRGDSHGCPMYSRWVTRRWGEQALAVCGVQGAASPPPSCSHTAARTYSHGRWGCGAHQQLFGQTALEASRWWEAWAKLCWETSFLMEILTVPKRWSAWGHPPLLTLETLGTPLSQ